MRRKHDDRPPEGPALHVVAEGDVRQAACPVCGEPVGPAPEICPSCKTPHHWDCWQYSGGCAAYGCPHKVRKRKGAATKDGHPAIPDKIPFPRLRAGTFLGVFHVRMTTAVFAFFCEFAATFAYGLEQRGLSMFFIVGMVSAVLWSATTAEVFNIDVVGGRVTKSLLFLGRELFEWGVCPLDRIHQLVVRADPSSGGFKRLLAAELANGAALPLTPAYDANSPDESAVNQLLDRIREGTTLPIAEKTVIAAEASELPPPAPPSEEHA